MASKVCVGGGGLMITNGFESHKKLVVYGLHII